MDRALRFLRFVFVAAAAGSSWGCGGRCTTFEAETHVLTAAVDAGALDAGTSPSVDQCRQLCGDDSDPSNPNAPHTLSCHMVVGDAGQPLVACDESAYQVCPGR